MKEIKDIHIGQLIDKRIKALGLSYAYVARALFVDRTTMYSIIRQKSIDIERLVKLSNILDYDFLECYHELVINATKTNLTIEQLKTILNSEVMTGFSIKISIDKKC